MTSRLIAGFVASLLVTPSLIAQEGDLEKFQGDWIWQSIESNGEKAKAVTRRFVYTFKGSEYVVSVDGGKPSGAIPFTLDPSKTPKTIDRTMASGNVLRGIYKLEGDTITICSEGRSGERPTEFKTTNKDWRLSVFKRIAN